MDYIIYQKRAGLYVEVDRGPTEKGAIKEAIEIARQWESEGLKPTTFKVCYNGQESKDICFVDTD